MVIMGASQSFYGPTMSAILPGIVPGRLFTQAAAWSASALQTASVIGPFIGGLLYNAGPPFVYFSAGIMLLLSGFLISSIRMERKIYKREPPSIKSIFAGISYIRSKPEILGAISLDLFAVLLGGATALLPVYAKDILKTGPTGLGLMRTAPAIGALIMSIFLARRPLHRKAGKTMFTAVLIFGLATIVFALSRSISLSLASLVVLGASDVISVVIRSSLVQLKTPDSMRGRVSAVNSMFIGTSNQLGAFESGITAAWFGTIPAVLIGGFGTIIVVIIWIFAFPGLAKADKLDGS
jgi:MFS family permease